MRHIDPLSAGDDDARRAEAEDIWTRWLRERAAILRARVDAGKLHEADARRLWREDVRTWASHMSGEGSGR